jgi:8-oxo-dGTP diphosphatase
VDTTVVRPEQRFVASERWQKGVRVVYEARVVGGELAAEVDGTTDEARWFPRDELGSLRRLGLVQKYVG